MSFEIGHDNVIDMVKAHSKIQTYRNLSATLALPQRYQQLMRSLGIYNDYPEPVCENPGRGYQSRKYEGFDLKFSQFRGDLEAFCPDCIRAETYWKKRWSLRIYTVCEKHGCELLDRCTKCQLGLTIERGCIYTCAKCNFDLRKSKSLYAKESEKSHVQSVFSKTSNSIKLKLTLNLFAAIDETFRDMLTDVVKMNIIRVMVETPEDAAIKLHHLLTKTKLDTHPRIQCLPLLMNCNSASIAEAALEKLGSMDFSGSKNWSIYYLKLTETAKALNVSLQVIKKFLQLNILSFVGQNSSSRIPSNLLIELLDKTPDELRGLIDKATGNTTGTLHFLCGTQAAELLGTNETIVWGLVKTKHLKTGIKMVNGYQRNTIERDSIEIFKKRYAMPGVLAEKFGVPKQNLSQRLRSLKIYPVSGPSIDGAITNIFKISDLQGLTKSKVKNAKVCSNKLSVIHKHKIDEDKYITMKCAATLLGIGMRSMTKLTKEGILNRIDIPHRNILIEKKSVNKLIKMINDPNYVRLQDLRKETGLQATPFWHYFINTEIIKIVQLFSWQLIHKRCIQKLNALVAKYVTEAEGNKMLGADRKKLTLLRKTGDVKFKTFTGKLYDAYFYSRESIEDLIKAKAIGL
jgi:uncharacterized protein (DUF1330 family)